MAVFVNDSAITRRISVNFLKNGRISTESEFTSEPRSRFFLIRGDISPATITTVVIVVVLVVRFGATTFRDQEFDELSDAMSISGDIAETGSDVNQFTKKVTIRLDKENGTTGQR